MKSVYAHQLNVFFLITILVLFTSTLNEASAQFNETSNSVETDTQNERTGGTTTTDDTTNNVQPSQSVVPIVKIHVSDRKVQSGETVTLDGGGSYCESTQSDTISTSITRGLVETFSWAQTDGGPSVQLSDTNGPAPTFIAPSVDRDTSLTFELTITCSDEQTATGSSHITIRPIASSNDDNTPPEERGSPRANTGDGLSLGGIVNEGERTVRSILAGDGTPNDKLPVPVELLVIGAIAIIITVITVSKSRHRHKAATTTTTTQLLSDDDNNIQQSSENTVDIVTEGGIE